MAVSKNCDHGLTRPFADRLRPVDIGHLRQFRQDRRDRAGIPRLGVEAGHADGELGVDALGGCLLGARRDPAEQDGGDDPAPLYVAQAPDRRAGRNDAVDLHDLARGLDGGGGCPPLPDVFEGRGRRDADRAHLWS